MTAATTPPPDPAETAPFWRAAAEGRLVLRHCLACDRTHHYPRRLCPFCHGDRGEWRPASGRGTVYAFAVQAEPEAPRVVALVSLDEGVTMLTNLVDCDPGSVAIGQPVRVTFRAGADGRVAPMFRPVADGERDA